MWKIHSHPIILTWDWSLQNVHQITFYAPLTIICINLKMYLAFCRLAFHPSNTSLLPPKVNLLIFFPKQRNLKSPGSWCSMNSKEFVNTTNTNIIWVPVMFTLFTIHLSILAQFSDNGRPNPQKKICLQIDAD